MPIPIGVLSSYFIINILLKILNFSYVLTICEFNFRYSQEYFVTLQYVNYRNIRHDVRSSTSLTSLWLRFFGYYNFVIITYAKHLRRYISSGCGTIIMQALHREIQCLRL